jgi:cytoskeletal protein CcmA (bactofilin family)
MSEFPRRRLMDRLGTSPTLIAQRTVFRGDIDTDGSLLVNGSVHGNGRVGGEVAISLGAQWEGDLLAQCGVIAGDLVGDILVHEKLEIGARARIRGRVTAQLIAIAQGALIDGEVVCTGSDPVVEFEEKRAAVPEA